MIAQLVRVSTPGVRVVTANPGDWGIDCFVGSLADEIVVWQSKYFIDGIAEAQKTQIRESFASVVKNSKGKGYAVRRWVLCIPVSMDAPATQWWDGWKKRSEKASGIEIELWDETELRALLISPDADSVYSHYYGSGHDAEDLPIVRLDDANVYDSALFVHQLEMAGHTELSSSKEQFFNAELVAREVHDKGIPEEVHALVNADAHVHAIWEARFVEASDATEGRKLPGLHRTVMADVRAERASLPRRLRLSVIHAMGLVHRVVEDGRAGWVRDFRAVALRYRAGLSDDVIEDTPPVAAAGVGDPTKGDGV